MGLCGPTRIRPPVFAVRLTSANPGDHNRLVITYQDSPYGYTKAPAKCDSMQTCSPSFVATPGARRGLAQRCWSRSAVKWLREDRQVAHHRQQLLAECDAFSW